MVAEKHIHEGFEVSTSESLSFPNKTQSDQVLAPSILWASACLI